MIQETRFFRDAVVFEQIAAWVRGAAHMAEEPLRVLSAPCSTGQEAYSLAATLAYAGLPPRSFAIDAFDLSPSAIAHARTGVYPEGALKQTPSALANACGMLRSHHWHMHDALRDSIHFERRNLIQPGALGRDAAYHLILCRNLVIYLHPQARAILGSVLAKALLPGGRLIIGAADRVPELDTHFAPIGPASSFSSFIKNRSMNPRRRSEFRPQCTFRAPSGRDRLSTKSRLQLPRKPPLSFIAARASTATAATCAKPSAAAARRSISRRRTCPPLNCC